MTYFCILISFAENCIQVISLRALSYIGKYPPGWRLSAFDVFLFQSVLQKQLFKLQQLTWKYAYNTLTCAPPWFSSASILLWWINARQDTTFVYSLFQLSFARTSSEVSSIYFFLWRALLPLILIPADASAMLFPYFEWECVRLYSCEYFLIFAISRFYINSRMPLSPSSF